MKTKSTLYADAYKYSEVYGFSVIPVGKDKKPLIQSWKSYQTERASSEQLKNWWTQFPDANIGIVTGQISGITVIDVDTHKGASSLPFPATFTVKTGNGGQQLYYKYAPGLTVSANAYSQFPHVDIRSDGGYVVAPPSRITPSTPEGKEREGLYEVIDSMDFAHFPIHLFPKQAKKSRFTDKLNLKTGSRNSSIASVIGTIIQPMHESKITSDGWEAVQAINKTYTPPLPQHELEATFTSIVKKELSRRSTAGSPTPSPLQLSPTERMDVLLRKNGSNVPYKDMTNALLVLEQHPTTQGKIRYNEFRQEIEFDGKTFEEDDILHLVHMMQHDAGLPNISKDTVFAAVQYYAHKNRYDEAKSWLSSLTWDGTPRLSEWLIRATGVPTDDYHRGVGAQWFMGIIKRIMQPGCIFDNVLVVVGKQGVGKTSMFRILGGLWYKSFTGTVENKDFYLTLRGAIIIDLDEGVAMYRSESIKMKSIITQTTDEYRAPYDRMMKKYPRRFVFSMSTNDTEPFRDVTGNRRYWTVDVQQKIDFKWLEDNRDQLFAEAYQAYKNKTPLPEVDVKVAEMHQENHLPDDPWTEAITDYVRKSYAYCTGDANYSLTIAEIFKDALKGDHIERLERKHEMRIATILRVELGMERRRIMEENDRRYRYFITAEKLIDLKAHPLVPLQDKPDTTFKDFEDAKKNF